MILKGRNKMDNIQKKEEITKGKVSKHFTYELQFLSKLLNRQINQGKDSLSTGQRVISLIGKGSCHKVIIKALRSP